MHVCISAGITSGLPQNRLQLYGCVCVGGSLGGNGGEGQREKADGATLRLLRPEQKSYTAFFFLRKGSWKVVLGESSVSGMDHETSLVGITE